MLNCLYVFVLKYYNLNVFIKNRGFLAVTSCAKIFLR